MKPFTPINFGSLWLALKRRKSQSVPVNFAVALRNSPAAGRVQRLHFYNVNGAGKQALYQNIQKSLQMETGLMPRPWSENLLPYIENDSFAEIVLRTPEFIIVRDGFPKVINICKWKSFHSSVLVKISFLVHSTAKDRFLGILDQTGHSFASRNATTRH